MFRQHLPEFGRFWRTFACFFRGWLTLKSSFFGSTERKLSCTHSSWFQAWQRLTSNHDAIAINIRTDTFETAENQPFFVTEDNVADTAHHLDDEAKTHALIAIGTAAIASNDLNHPLPSGLYNGLDARPLQVLTQQH